MDVLWHETHADMFINVNAVDLKKYMVNSINKFFYCVNSNFKRKIFI